jgi:hypothetical protein
MLIDCDRCEVRGPACDDCVVGVLLGVPDPRTAGPSGAVHLEAPERRALDVLADQGLVPRLRLVPRTAERTGREELASRDERRKGSARDAG